VANTRSARKRIKTSEKRRLRNRAVRSQVRSQVKTARSVEPTQGAEGRAAIQDAIRSLDKAVSRGVIHRNTAARRKSSLARRLALVK
jgi:small subunit ribosomal protein S20